MKLIINDQYFITVDELNVTVFEVLTRGAKSARKGETYEKPVSYHATLEQACTSLLRYVVHKSELEDMFAIVGLISRAEQEIVKACKGNDWRKIKEEQKC